MDELKSPSLWVSVTSLVALIAAFAYIYKQLEYKDNKHVEDMRKIEQIMEEFKNRHNELTNKVNQHDATLTENTASVNDRLRRLESNQSQNLIEEDMEDLSYSINEIERTLNDAGIKVAEPSVTPRTRFSRGFNRALDRKSAPRDQAPYEDEIDMISSRVENNRQGRRPRRRRM